MTNSDTTRANRTPTSQQASQSSRSHYDSIACQNQQKSPFLRLPAELRNEIYSYVFNSATIQRAKAHGGTDSITSSYTLFFPPFTLTMPPKRAGGRPKDSRNLTEAQKGAIVALRQFSGTDQVKKACAEASLEPSLTNLLATVNSTPIGPPGAQPKDATRHVLQEVGITVSQPTLINIAHDHRDQEHDYAIVRGVRPKKPELDDDDIRNRERYCAWIFFTYDRFAPRLIFVCYDETSKSIGGRNNRGGKQYVWRPRGAPANQYALPYRPPAFNLMICAATSSDTTLTSPKRPCLVWVAEEDEDREETLERVRRANEKARRLIDNKRARAEVAGTQEERALREINQNITRNNKVAKAANKAAGVKGGAIRKGVKNPVTPAKFFKYKDFIYKSGKGMNGIWYAERVLKDVLFPYYEAVRASNPGAQVFLVQDNVYLHGLGLRYCAPKIEEKDTRFAPHSPNSPDLHPIERCFGRLEGFLGDYEVKSAFKQAKADAVAFVQSIWQEDETMRQYMAHQLHPDHFRDVANACKAAGYSNNFTA
ncbi:hypothetical protein EJ07DRAFT_179378 [Lizonia empirigonia]|nr:hypothetical protein EJ07DRAFT_179378 [Lizonia empirigonia]